MKTIKQGTWLSDLVAVYNELGGTAAYKDVYPMAELKRKGRGASWTREAHASIRRTVEDHAESSRNFRGHAVFYSVNGHGRGVWGLLPEFLIETENKSMPQSAAYLEGIEGIVQEQSYLRKSRDPRLVELRKEFDNYTCQVCGFRLMIDENKFVIDVHHLNPLGSIDNIIITSLDDLVCLCPTCHRIAHSRSTKPLSLDEIRTLTK